MYNFLRTIVLLFIAFAVAALAVANRHVVRFMLDPFASGGPGFSVEAPFFLYLFLALFTGLALGGFSVWVSQGRWRRTARLRRREAEELRRETERLGRQLRGLEQTRLVSAPALSGRPAAVNLNRTGQAFSSNCQHSPVS